MRELLIEEIKPTCPTINTEHLKLVEMRLQTLILAGIAVQDLRNESKNFK